MKKSKNSEKPTQFPIMSKLPQINVAMWAQINCIYFLLIFCGYIACGYMKSMQENGYKTLISKLKS